MALRILEAPEERCDGIDDDADGLVDDGFPDLDGDGVADCVDVSCALDLSSEGVVARSCTSPEPDSGFWRLEVEEYWRGEPSEGLDGRVLQVLLSTPATELGRGDIFGYELGPAGDWQTFRLGAEGGAHKLSVGEVFAETLIRPPGYEDPGLLILNPGVGDRSLSLLGAEGETIWETQPTDELVNGHLAIGDMDCDGVPDVANARQVYSGATGMTLLDLPGAEPFQHPKLLVDLDDDGCDELIHAGVAYDAQGSVLWSVPSEWYDWWVPVQLDADPFPEFVVVQSGGGLLLDDDGATLASGLFGGGFHGAPCLANFDSDAEPEIGFMTLGTEQTAGVFAVYDLDGAELWSVPADAEGGAMGCSAHDFDGDGQYEVLFRDFSRLWIRSGSDGALLFSMFGVGLWGDFSYPVPVDIDGDGSVEVLLGVGLDGEGDPGGVLILGSPTDAFLPGAEGWASFDNRLSNIDPTGRSPLGGAPSWLDHNTVRAAPQRGRRYADLRPELVDSCLSGCLGGAVYQVAVAVVNEGEAPSREGSVVELWELNDAGEAVSVRESWPLGSLAAGERTEPWTVTLPWNEGPRTGLRLVVDGSSGVGATAECDESNNALDLVRPSCP